MPTRGRSSSKDKRTARLETRNANKGVERKRELELERYRALLQDLNKRNRYLEVENARLNARLQLWKTWSRSIGNRLVAAEAAEAPVEPNGAGPTPCRFLAELDVMHRQHVEQAEKWEMIPTYSQGIQLRKPSGPRGAGPFGARGAV
jgi:hypothetical protein